MMENPGQNRRIAVSDLDRRPVGHGEIGLEVAVRIPVLAQRYVADKCAVDEYA